MEYKKVKCNTVYIREDSCHRFGLFKTRPIRHEGERIYKCNTATIFSVTDDDIETLLNYCDKDNSQTDFKHSFMWRCVFMDYLKENYFNVPCVTTDSYKSLISQNQLVDYTINVFVADDFVELTNETSAEKACKKRKEDQEVNEKLVNAFFAPNIKAVLNKYGLEISWQNNIIFSNADSYKNFIMEAIKNTVIKDLEELGLEVKLNKKWMNFDRYTKLFKAKDIVIKKDKLK